MSDPDDQYYSPNDDDEDADDDDDHFDTNDDFDAEDDDSPEGSSEDPDPFGTCPHCDYPFRPVQKYLLRTEPVRCLFCGKLVPPPSPTPIANIYRRSHL